MRPLASTPSNICKERVFSQVATFLPFLLVFQGFLPLLAHSLRIPWECRVLGTFYQDDAENLVFGADLENFYSAHNYSVYKPSGVMLEKIVNFREGDTIPGQVADVRIGVVR